MIHSESAGGGISDAPTAVLGESEESHPSPAGSYALNFLYISLLLDNSAKTICCYFCYMHMYTVSGKK